MARVYVSSGSEADMNFDHEQHAGMIIPDPWDDPEQTDWPMATAEEVAGNGLGTDQGNDDLA